MEQRPTTYQPSTSQPTKISLLPTRPRRELPRNYKILLQELETRRLKEEIKICIPPNTLDKVIEARIHGKVFLLRRYVRCGKHCKKCPHGPYWYGFYRNKGRFISFYIGKILAPRFEKAKKISIIREIYGGEDDPNQKQQP